MACRLDRIISLVNLALALLLLLLGSLDPNTIPGPARIRCSRFRIVSYVSARTPLCLDLATFYVSSDSVLSGYVLS